MRDLISSEKKHILAYALYWKEVIVANHHRHIDLFQIFINKSESIYR